jgi:3-oxoacyl-[acyl-carrier-protein] synthase-1
MLRIAACALSEATQNLPDIEQSALYLGIPQQTPDRPGTIGHRFIEHLSLQSGVPFDTGKSMLFPMGRAAGLIAIGSAITAVTSGNAPYAIVGGVDTYVDLYRLGTLDMEGRIAGERLMDGFIPGEGAAFLVIGRGDKANSNPPSPIARLTAVGKAHEPGHMYSDQPYQGEGLAEAVSQFFTASGITEPIQAVFTSMNGENHWAKEWGVAHMRNQSNFSPDHGFHHPADCLGDTGAASGIIMINLAAIGLSKGYSKSPILVFCSSDHGERAAVGVLRP